MIPVVYGELCPQCGGDLSWFEIEDDLCRRKNKKLSYNELTWKYREFERFFYQKVGSRPRAIQRMWAKRVLQGTSFAAIAPTGIGKTLFGAVMASYFAENGMKSYIMVPTTLLLKEVADKIKGMGYGEKLVYYYGRMGKKEKEDMKKKIGDGDFNILLTTTAFLSKNYAMISKISFKFIFVDDVDSLLKRSRNLDKIVSLVLRGKSVLMVSTATGSRGYNTKILREKLNFDVGNMRNAVRNVMDIYASKDRLRYIMDSMGPGALIFTPTAEEARKLMDELGDYRIGLVLAQDKEAYKSFQEGSLDYLLGVATPYGSLVRGIDMPERIRYVVFYGIPRFKVGIEDVDSLSEKLLLTLAYLLREEKKEIAEMIEKKEIDALRKVIKKIFLKGELRGKGFVYEDSHIIFPDVRTYLQGSGRASRLYSGGISKGASFLLDEDRFLEIFIERAGIYGLEFHPIEEVDIDSLRREIDEDRRRMREKVPEKEVIRPALFIVESPNKAKHIARFFGKPNVRVVGNAIVYEVATGENVLIIAPSLGHVVDLSTSRGYHGVIVKDSFIPVYNPIRKCKECGYQFTEGDKCPICNSENIYRAKEQIDVLRILAYECENVIIGTDPDTEGEKIAWDLRNLLIPYAKEIRRAEFHEVTKKAILNALDESRDLNEDLVKAQIVRRVEDRWIGFELSHILWKEFGDKNLSAGRAQTPTLGWIIRRYEESRKKMEVWFLKGTDIKVPWSGRVYGEIKKVGEKIREYLVAPYTTDEVLKDANKILKIGSTQAMAMLQNLFEMGLITYHRTDSTHVSEEGLKIAKRYLGDEFIGRRWGEEGAHECIRPTRPWSAEDIKRYVNEGIISLKLEEGMLKLYDLIFRRFMASQSYGEIKIARYLIRAGMEGLEVQLIIDADGRAYRLYPYRLKIYKPLKEGRGIIELEKRIISPPLYTQADVIRLMKEMGIGRPSTYATIMGKLFKRGYVKEKGGKLIPTKRGKDVYSFLIKKYEKFISEERTRMLEEKMMMVERGERKYDEILHELYEEMMELRGK